MGNCQTAETEAAVLQHPDGRIERLYWPTAAIEVMRINPGHYVALATTISLPTTTAATSSSSSNAAPTTFRLTKLRLLRPKETLIQGCVYRLVTSHEVVKALKVRKKERLRQQQKHKQVKKPASARQETEEHQVEEGLEVEVDVSDDASDQMASQPSHSQQQDDEARLERHRQKAAQSAAKARQWRPSLQSISEAVA